MKTININFDIKSIKKAIKQLEKVENKLNDNLIADFLTQCLTWIKDTANINLEQSGISQCVVADIENSWQIEIDKKNHIGKYINTEDRAKYIEFGVGIVGAENGYNSTYYPDMADYEYNKPSIYKKSDNSWIFKIKYDTRIDIKAENILSDRQKHKTTIRTKGQEAQYFIYNAINTFIEQNQGQIIWEQVINKNLK